MPLEVVTQKQQSCAFDKATSRCGASAAKICCDAQQTLLPNVITSARPGSDRRGKPHEAAAIHYTSRRRGSGLAAHGTRAARGAAVIRFLDPTSIACTGEDRALAAWYFRYRRRSRGKKQGD